jgi:hypothetical protein
MVTTVVAAASAPAAAGPAEDGAGWYWSWAYSSPTTFAFDGGLKDMRVLAFGTDNVGVRQVSGTLFDTNAYDGRCAMVELSTSQGLLIQRLACNGSSMSFSTGSFTDTLTVALYRVYFQAGTMHVDQRYRAEIPDSYYDSGVRTTDTGGYWFYLDSDNVGFNLRRPGVSFYGELHHAADDTRRAITGTVARTGGNNCVAGSVVAADRTSLRGQTCWNRSPGPSDGYSPTVSHDGLVGSLHYNACAQDDLFTPDFGFLWKCLDGTIPMPYTAN